MLQVLGGKQGVGRKRADQIKTLEAQLCKCGLDYVDLFTAQMATLASVRVESANQNARLGNMKFLNQILERPRSERPFILLVVGYPAEGAVVPDITKKSLDQIASFR